MNQDRDKKWWELCRAAATEQDSSKLMELVAEIIKELDQRDRKLKSARSSTLVTASASHAAFQFIKSLR